MIPQINFIAAWIGITLGVVSGIVMGLRFHHDDWLGGYTSWPRRMIRLGHISFFGLAFINIAFAWTWGLVVRGRPAGGEVGALMEPAGWALLAAAMLMPAVCYLAAWRRQWGHMFFFPVVAASVGVGFTLWAVMQMEVIYP